jgi:hypothetical protein
VTATPPRPPGPPPPTPPPSRVPTVSTRGSRRWLVVALALLLVLGGAIGAAIALSGGGSSSSANRKEVFTEALSTASNPFTTPVGTDNTQLVPVQQGGSTTQRGGLPGLYGGTRNQSSCDRNQLITFLSQHPDKATAWASTLGIAPAQISTYVKTLTPVLLRTDTRVTNHGFVNGRATSFQSVLQAGTAVLVDARGAVVTKCYCGNPLTGPLSYPPVYVGTKWAGFSANNLTVITPNPTTIDTFTLVDVATGQQFQRPAGTAGSSDSQTSGSNTGPSNRGSTTTTTHKPTTSSSRTTAST